MAKIVPLIQHQLPYFPPVAGSQQRRGRTKGRPQVDRFVGRRNGAKLSRTQPLTATRRPGGLLSCTQGQPSVRPHRQQRRHPKVSKGRAESPLVRPLAHPPSPKPRGKRKKKPTSGGNQDNDAPRRRKSQPPPGAPKGAGAPKRPCPPRRGFLVAGVGV